MDRLVYCSELVELQPDSSGRYYHTSSSRCYHTSRAHSDSESHATVLHWLHWLTSRINKHEGIIPASGCEEPYRTWTFRVVFRRLVPEGSLLRPPPAPRHLGTLNPRAPKVIIDQGLIRPGSEGSSNQKAVTRLKSDWPLRSSHREREMTRMARRSLARGRKGRQSPPVTNICGHGGARGVCPPPPPHTHNTARGPTQPADAGDKPFCSPPDTLHAYARRLCSLSTSVLSTSIA
jgi:hypothetical protein